MMVIVELLNLGGCTWLKTTTSGEGQPNSPVNSPIVLVVVP
jgi:hypothetical protein